MVDSELQQIRDDLQSLKLLYRRLAEDRIGRERASVDDIESITASDETVSKDDFLRLLEEAPVKRGGASVRRKR